MQLLLQYPFCGLFSGFQAKCRHFSVRGLKTVWKKQLIDLKEGNDRCLYMIELHARAHKEIKLTVGVFLYWETKKKRSREIRHRMNL